MARGELQVQHVSQPQVLWFVTTCTWFSSTFCFISWVRIYLMSWICVFCFDFLLVYLFKLVYSWIEAIAGLGRTLIACFRGTVSVSPRKAERWVAREADLTNVSSFVGAYFAHKQPKLYTYSYKYICLNLKIETTTYIYSIRTTKTKRKRSIELRAKCKRRTSLKQRANNNNQKMYHAF